MSDLAPFVASTIRDKVVADLLEENKLLKEQLASFRRIRITGRGGEPLYAEQDFSLGKSSDHGWWIVRLPVWNNRNCQSKQAVSTPSIAASPCRMSKLADCEIYVGNFRNMTCREFDVCFVDGNPKGYFSLYASKGIWLCCYLENISDHQFQCLCRAAAEENNLSNIFQHFEDPLVDLNVYFTHVTFCGGSASEAMNCLGFESQTNGT